MKHQSRQCVSLLTVAAALLFTVPAEAQFVGGAASTTTTTASTTTAGTISEFGPDALMVRTEAQSAPIRYSYTESTQYVDEAGSPVSRELVRSGLPVTVQYVREGDRMIANRVIVRKQTTTTTAPLPAPTVIERNTTVTQPPVVVEKPVIVEKRVPVVVEKKVPVVVEKPVIIEKPVVIEKRVKPAREVIEEKTTTTTTTTERK